VFVHRSTHSSWIAGFLLILGCLSISAVASAELRLLESLEFNESTEEWEILIRFASPIRTLRHSPESKGDLIEVAFEPLSTAPGRSVPFASEDVLLPPASSSIPLREVRVEVGADQRALLLIQLDHSMPFRLQPGRDFRSISIWIAKDSPSAPGSSRDRVMAASPVAEMMEEARAALAAGDVDRAIALYTLVLQAPSVESDPFVAEALEYLGLARQRNGQTAHARAEYQAYLVRFPDGEGSVRVRQRLAAIDTAEAAPPEALRQASEPVATRFDYFGSIYTAYYRTESFADLSGARLVDSSQLLDGDLGVRLRRGPYEVGARVAGYLRYDIDEKGSEVPSRVTRLFVEGRQHELEFGGVLGRQSSKGAGVLGRFDGLWADWAFMDGWAVKAVAGFPLLTSVSNGINTDQQVYGVSIESSGLIDGLNAELYGVGQFVDGLTDRAALGLEVRYLNEHGSVFSVIDFDVHFVDLNLATLSGSWRVTPATSLNLVIDYRYSPFLTARNALRGQPESNLDDLQDRFDDDEIDDLAKDRTPRVTTLVAGASHRFNQRFELNGDFTATMIGKTSGSGGAAGYPSNGWEFHYVAQLVAWNWLTEDGSERVGLRFFDGQRYDALDLNLSGRYTVLNDLRLTPVLRFRYRMNQQSQDFIELDPGLRFEYRLYGLVLDCDFVFQWLQGIGSTNGAPRRDELGYVLNLGLRYDF